MAKGSYVAPHFRSFRNANPIPWVFEWLSSLLGHRGWMERAMDLRESIYLHESAIRWT